MGFDNIIYVLKSKMIEPQSLKSADVQNACIEFIEYVEKKYNCHVESCLVDDSYLHNNK